MNRKKKASLWVGAAVVLLAVSVAGGLFLSDYSRQPFEQTTVFPDEGRDGPADTTIVVNGIEVKMIGVKGGKMNCKGEVEAMEIKDFYIGETEVTQELWMSVMGDNPSVHRDSVLCPVEGVDLVECIDFVHKLDSISGVRFYVQTYFEWLYVAHLGCKDSSYQDDSMSWHKENSGNVTHPVKQKEPNALGVYDLIGNVAEWTVSGSDPLFFAAGGSYETEKESSMIDGYDINHANIKMGSLGLRLVCYPKDL